MDYLEDRVEAMWHDLWAAAFQPQDPSEVAALVSTILRAAHSDEAACRLGQAHAVVRLAWRVLHGSSADPRLTPERAAVLVVVAGYLAEPSLSERWFGYALDGLEFEAFAAMALGAYRSVLQSPGGPE